MRDIMEKIDQATKIIGERNDLDMTIGEMKGFFTSFEDYKEKNSIGDALFHLIEDVYLFGLGIGYQAGKDDSK